MEILWGMGIGFFLMAVALFVYKQIKAAIQGYIDREVADAYGIMAGVFFDESKTDTSDSNENSLAKADEIPHNLAVKESEPKSESDTPFWNDKDRLKEMRDTLAGEKPSEMNPENEDDLAGLSPLEKWRVIDSRLLDLENTDSSHLDG